MTGAASFVARIALSVPGAVAVIVLPAFKRFFRIDAKRFDRMLLGAFVTSRIFLFVLVFGVWHIQARGGIPGFYLPEAEAAIHGLLPYSGFPSSYAPLHAYLDGAALWLWHSSLSLILIALAGECLALALWQRVARALVSDEVCRTAALLYFASPLSTQFVTIDGQDNSVLALLFALSLLMILRNRPFASGTAFGLGLAVIKFLPLLFAPQFFITLTRRWRWLAGVGATCAVVYGLFFLKHSDLLFPLRSEAALTTASNLPYLVTFMTGFSLRYRVYDGILLIVLAGCFVWLGRTARGFDLPSRVRVLVFAAPVLLLVLSLLSKKSWPNYLILVLFNLCLLPVFRSIGHRIGFAAVQVSLCTSHSYWATFLIQADAVHAHAALVAHERTALIFLLQQILLIVAYSWLLALLVRAIGGAGRAGAGSAPAVTMLAAQSAAICVASR